MLKIICSVIVAASVLAPAYADDPVGTITVNPELTIIATVGGDQCLFKRGLGDSVIIQCVVDAGTVNITIEHFAEALVRVSNPSGISGSFREISWHFGRNVNTGNLDFDILALKLRQTGSLPPLQ